MSSPVARLLGTLQGRFQLAAGSVLCVGFAVGSALAINFVRQGLYEQHHYYATTIVDYLARCIDRKDVNSVAPISVAKNDSVQKCVNRYASQSLILWVKMSSGSLVLPREIPVAKSLASSARAAHSGDEHEPSSDSRNRIARIGRSTYLIHLHASDQQIQYWTAEEITGRQTEGGNIVAAMTLLWAAVLLASIVIIYLLSRKISKPLNQLVSSVNALTAESMAFEPVHVAQGAPAEIIGLAEAFDHLLKRLSQSFENQKQFSNGVSHELRTPLTIMSGIFHASPGILTT